VYFVVIYKFIYSLLNMQVNYFLACLHVMELIGMK